MKAEGGTNIHNKIMDKMMKTIQMMSEFLLLFFVSGTAKEGVINVKFFLQECKSETFEVTDDPSGFSSGEGDNLFIFPF